MRTVGQQGGMIFPTGLGIGATQLGCMVMSPSRAAGMLAIITVADASEIIPGPPGTQGIRVHGFVVSIMRAAGGPPMSTVGAPWMIGSGSAGCGTGTGIGAAG